MSEVTNSKLNEIDSLLEMIEFLFKSADQEKLKGLLPLSGITLTLTQLRAKIYEISTSNSKVSALPSFVAGEQKPKLEEQVSSSEIKKEKVEAPTFSENKENLEDENLADFVKGLSSTLSKRIQMLPIDETEKIPPTRQGRIRQLLNKDLSQLNEDIASE